MRARPEAVFAWALRRRSPVAHLMPTVADAARFFDVTIRDIEEAVDAYRSTHQRGVLIIQAANGKHPRSRAVLEALL
jgi:hypothetical protein